MVKIGNLFTTITADASGYSTNFKTARNENEKFTKSTQRADDSLKRYTKTSERASRSTTTVSRSSKRGTQAMLELSRGVEDAAVSFGTGGFAGAIRGAGNNISQMLAIMGPGAGVIGGFGVAIGSILVNQLSKAGDETKKLADELSKLDKTIDRIRTKQKTGRDIEVARREAVRIPTTKDALRERASSRDAVNDALRRVRQERLARLEGTEQQLRDLPRSERVLIGRGLQGFFGRDAKPSPIITNNPKLRKRLENAALEEFDSRLKEARRKSGAQFNATPSGAGSFAGFEELLGSRAVRGTTRGRQLSEAALGADASKNVRAADAAFRVARERDVAIRKRAEELSRQEKQDRIRIQNAGLSVAGGLGLFGGALGSGAQSRVEEFGAGSTASQRIASRLRINSLERQLLGPKPAQARLQGPNTAAIGRRGAFETQSQAVRELARANQQDPKQSERDRLAKERTDILRKQLEEIRKDKRVGVVTLD